MAFWAGARLGVKDGGGARRVGQGGGPDEGEGKEGEGRAGGGGG